MKINHLIHSLQHGKEQYILTKEGTLDKFLGINITKLDDNCFKLTQPFLIER